MHSRAAGEEFNRRPQTTRGQHVPGLEDQISGQGVPRWNQQRTTGTKQGIRNEEPIAVILRGTDPPER